MVEGHAKEDAEILFFTVATGFYENYILSYVFFARVHNPSAKFEICVKDVEAYENRAKRALEYLRLKTEIEIREIPKFDKEPLIDNSYRFIINPITKCAYTYIGDIDIAVLENVWQAHRHILSNNKTYSNMIRPGTKMLTGLHLTISASQYPLPEIDDLIEVTYSDEELLYAIVERQGRLQEEDNHPYRPTLGIHISLNRIPFAGDRPGYDLTDSYLNKLHRVVSNLEFAELFAKSDEESRAVLKTIVMLAEWNLVRGSIAVPEWKSFATKLSDIGEESWKKSINT